MTRRATTWVTSLGILFIAIQFVPFGRDHANPPVSAEPTWDRADTRAIFFRACKDCHSNETTWPWYSYVAPVSWMVQKHVTEARAEFNVSRWGTGKQEADEAAEQVREEHMPLWTYRVTHPEARLDDLERADLVTGLVATFGEEHEESEDDEDSAETASEH